MGSIPANPKYDMKLSVIIPVYNVAPWIRECLESVRTQTLDDWECICVDDGSTDGSHTILEEFATDDPRFRILTKPHSNAGAARNAGLNNANGEYLLFLDSDDVFSPWMFETLVNAAEQNQADIAVCSFSAFIDGGNPIRFTRPGNLEWKNGLDECSQNNDSSALGGAAWNKLIANSLVTKHRLRFLEQPSTNDYTFVVLALVLSEKVIVSDAPFVGYRQRRGSIQSAKDPRYFFSAVQAVFWELKRRNRMTSLTEQDRNYLALDIIFQSICDLRSQKTRKDYWFARSRIRALDTDIRDFASRLNVRPSDNSVSAFAIRRYRSIIENGLKEQIHSALESLFAPLVGNRTRLSGRKARLAQFIHRALVSAFESPKWPWNR